MVTAQGSEALLGQATPPGTGEMPCEGADWRGSGQRWPLLTRPDHHHSPGRHGAGAARPAGRGRPF